MYDVIHCLILQASEIVHCMEEVDTEQKDERSQVR